MPQRIVAVIKTKNPGIQFINWEEVWNGGRLVSGCANTPIDGVRAHARRLVAAGKVGTIEMRESLEGLEAGISYNLAEL